jgi:hypothetical protein
MGVSPPRLRDITVIDVLAEIRYMADMNMEIVKTTVKKYEVFRSYSVIKSGVNFAGRFYCIEPDVAFIAYTRPFRNNGMRAVVWPHVGIAHGNIDLDWLNLNVRTLARVIVNPLYLGRGLAEYLISETLGRVDVPFIECTVITHFVGRILLKLGFRDYGPMRSGRCNYFVYSRPRRASLFDVL